jgi:hypothetical protein
MSRMDVGTVLEQSGTPIAPDEGNRRAIKLGVKVEKTNVELGIVWGWASVADILDSQGDVIPQDELEQAFYQFMEDYYDGAAVIGDNHEEVAKAVIIESCLEWRAGNLRWWVGVKLRDEALLEEARAGKISGFSIGGWATQEKEEA